MTQEIATFSEFAEILGKSRAWVTALRKDDRLALTEDGKRVRVAESLARIEHTRDRSKDPVAERHAAARAEPQETIEPQPVDGEASVGYQHWRERSERAKALAAERENEIADGKLLAAADIVQAVKASVTTLRTRLESLPDALAPQVVTIADEGKARALLAGEIEHALHELERQFGAMAREAA